MSEEYKVIDSVEALTLSLKKVKKAQKEFAKYSQEQVDKIFQAAAIAANQARIPLAKMAVEETGMGVVEDKVIKNHYAAEYIYNKYKNEKTCGIIEEDENYGIKKIAEPIGVIAAVIPTTNPTSTAIFKTLIALKTRNGIIISPHPRAKKSTIEAAKIVYMLQPFMPPGSKYVVKAPKIFFYDTGLAAYLTRWNNPDSLETGAQSNDFFTTWVIMEIYKSYSNICIIPPIYYLRNFNGKEIGLIIYINKIAYPIIIDKSANPEKATKLFSILEPVAHDANISIGPGAVICFIDALTTSTKNIHYVPAWII